jgi:hypothetical protein
MLTTRLPAARALFAGSLRSHFHSTSRAFVKVGDKIPDVELMENSPGNKISLAKELKGKGVIIGTQLELAQSSPLPAKKTLHLSPKELADRISGHRRSCSLQPCMLRITCS